MTPFHRAREAAKSLREELFKTAASSGIRSNVLIDAVAREDAEDFEISPASPQDAALGGADAMLVRNLRQIIFRNDVASAERAFLIAHEFGHWKLHSEDHDSCHKVIDSNLKPEEGETFGAQKVEAYGARERAELQANIFARELLLPREVARTLFLSGKTAKQLQKELNLPLELVRQQLLDGLLLPEPRPENELPAEPIIPTEEQISAASSTAKTSLVVAGPGTGKTATLLMRVQHLISKGVKPSEMLLLTFSNRAARELVDRLQALGVQDAHDIWVGTFHAFGLEFLRKNHEQFGLSPRFGVADKMAQIAVLEPHIYGLRLTAFNPLGDPLDWLNDVVKTIQRAKDELADVSAFSRAVEDSAPDTSAGVLAKQRDVVKLYECYESKMRADGGLVDMGDLVMLPAVALTESYTKFKASVGRFRHILVDEYQDVNRASAQLVKSLANNAECLWVVGDARQAIYRFRGASMRNIVNFGDDFPGHQTFHLNQNRRSYEEIIRVFEHTGRDANNPLQMVLPLDDVEPVRGSSGTKPRHIQCADDGIVHGELVANARRLHSIGVSYCNQAVLASNHETCGAAADALNAAGVPALHLGDIFQRREVKDLLALLQLFVDRSGSGLLRLARLPGLQAPPADVELILRWLKTNKPLALSWLKAPPPGLSPEGTATVQCWAKAFEGMTSTASPWMVACELLLDRTEILRSHLAGDTILDITRRIALWQFIYYLRVPDGARAYQTVGSFITRLRRRLRVGDDKELRIPPPEADSLDAIAVMTIHGSKGLEFEAVHLVDIDARHFSMSTDSELVPRSLFKSISPKENFEEETEASNKLYVALSRAKRHLVLYETRQRFDAACVAAVGNAAHLLDQLQGVAIGVQVPPPPEPTPQNSGPSIAELAGLLSYRVCPRRYYYDFVRQLSPAAGLHPAAHIETAVIRELFTNSATPSDSLNAVTRALDSLPEVDSASELHLRAYAKQLLENGRAWLGLRQIELPPAFDINCDGMPLRIAAHRVVTTGSVVKLSFVRIRPFGKYTRQHKVLRWVLMQLAKAYPRYSFIGEVFILSAGTSVSVSPYIRLTNDTFSMSLKSLLSGNFTPKSSSWECPKCRHFMHCPA